MASTKSPARPKKPKSPGSRSGSGAVVGADTRAAQRRIAAWAGDESKLVVMGRIVGSFGVEGWLKVKTFTEESDALGEFQDWLVRTRGGWVSMRLEGFEVHSKGPVARLAGCADRNAADALRGCDVAVPRDALGDADEGTLYWVDVVGLEVVDESGESLGKVEALFEAGDASVLVVRGAKERMIPFVPDYVKAVDREAGRITVHWKADYDA